MTEVRWTAKVLTLFPDMFPGPLGFSLAGKALDKGFWALETTDIRKFSNDKQFFPISDLLILSIIS